MNISTKDLEEIVKIIKRQSAHDYDELEILDEKLSETLRLLEELTRMLRSDYATQPPPELMEEIDCPDFVEY